MRSQKSRKRHYRFPWQTQDKPDRTSSDLYWHYVNKTTCRKDNRFLFLFSMSAFAYVTFSPLLPFLPIYKKSRRRKSNETENRRIRIVSCSNDTSWIIQAVGESFFLPDLKILLNSVEKFEQKLDWFSFNIWILIFLLWIDWDHIFIVMINKDSSMTSCSSEYNMHPVKRLEEKNLVYLSILMLSERRGRRRRRRSEWRSFVYPCLQQIFYYDNQFPDEKDVRFAFIPLTNIRFLIE